MTTPAELNLTPAEAKTDLLNFSMEQHKDGRADETIRSRTQSLRQVAKTTDLNNPDKVKEYISNATWNNKTKIKFIDTYSAYLRFKHLTWTPPRYIQENKMPFIPSEQEIDQLIAGTGKITSTVLQMLKETGMRIGELTKLKWTDLDTERKLINITPEKGSNPRILPISNKLINMLSIIPKNRTTIFQPDKRYLRTYLDEQRNNLATKLNNPRLKQITFHTLRHWKGTTEYHKTKDIMHVKAVLGHKTITSTMIYINLENALYQEQDNGYTCEIAHNETEAIQLIETGFEYITDINGHKLFKKRK